MATLIVLIFASAAFAETQKERLARLGKEVFTFEDIESPSSTQNTLLSSFSAASGFCNARPEPEFERNPDGSLGRRFDLVDVRLPEAKLRKLFDRVEGTPGAYLVEQIDVRRDKERGGKDFRGTMTVVAIGFDAEDVATDSQAEVVANTIQRFLDRPTWGGPIVAAVATASANAVSVDAIRVDEKRRALDLEVSGESIAAAQAFAAGVGADPALAGFKKPAVKAGPEKKRFSVSLVRKERPAAARNKRLLRRDGPAAPTPTAAPPPRHGVEPRPRIRPAAEVLDDLAREKLWSYDDLELGRPRAEILALLRSPTETTAVAKALLVTETAGPLPLRVWEANLALDWEEIAPLAARVSEMSRASALLGVDLHEVPPPRRDKARPERRVIRFQGNIRVGALGYRPEAMVLDTAQETLDRAKAWLERRADLGAPLEAAIEGLPPECVVERLAATQERLEVRIAGVRMKEAEQYAERLADMPEIGDLFGPAEVGRQADTFIIGLDRK